jgi:hypothetical protein
MFDEDFKYLKRSAIIITPNQPFFDLLLTHDSAMVIDEDVKAGKIYLLPDYDNTQEIEKWLNKHFDELFEEELFGWYIDETMWPPNRNFTIFRAWFSYSLYPFIMDTQKGFVEKF